MASYIGTQPIRQQIIGDSSVTSGNIIDGTVAGADLATDITISTTGTITTSQVNLGDNEKIVLGTSGSDFDMFHQGSYTALRNFTGNLYLGAPSSGGAVAITNQTISTTSARFDIDGPVELYYNNSKKFETSNTGATITGTLVADELTVDTDSFYVDPTNEKVNIGTTAGAYVGLNLYKKSGPGNIYAHFNGHPGTKIGTSLLHEGTTGDFIINTRDNADIRIYTNNTLRSEFKANGNFYVDTNTLYVDATNNRVGIGTSSPSYKLEVTGDAYVSTNLTIGGNLTVSGTTTTINTTNTQVSDNLLELNSGATANTNDAGIIIERGSTGDNAIMAWDESADQFIFGTTTATASDTGNLTITAGNISVSDITSSGDINLADDSNLYFGTDNDLRLFHESSTGNSYIYHGTTSPFYIRTDKLRVTNKGVSESMIQADANGEVRLYYDNSEKLNTSSTGVTVTGTVVSDGLTVDTNTLYVDSSNNRVGIGKSNPETLLDVNGPLFAGNTVRFGLADANNTILEIGQGATGNKFALTDYVGDTTYTDYGLRIGRNDTGANTDSLIIHRGTGALSLNAQDAGVIQFKTSNSEAMRINSSGNVGIGTGSPEALLHVSSTTTNSLIRVSSADGFLAGIDFGDVSDTDAGRIRYNSDDSFSIFTNTAEAMRIDSSGNVGIGTTSPSTALDVVGTITASGTIESIAPERHSIRPSLNLDFANSKVLDPRITFTRGSSGVYYDGYSSVKAEENLYSYSEQFNDSFWTRSNFDVTSNDTTAPNGETTAEKILENGNTGYYFVKPDYSTLSNTTYAISVYVKSINKTLFVIRGSYASATDWISAEFNLSTGTATLFEDSSGVTGTNISASMTDVGNSWYRCEYIFNTGSNHISGTTRFFGTDTRPSDGSGGSQSYTGNTSNGYYLWGGQLEQRDAVTAYTPTTSSPITKYQPQLQTVGSNIARFDHNPTTGESLGLLIEEQRTNLIPSSEVLSTFSASNLTRIDNLGIAPDGTTTADFFYEGTSGGIKQIYKTSVAITSGTSYTASLYVKASGRTEVMIEFDGGGFPSASVEYNLSTLAVTENGSGTGNIEYVGNDWYRISATATADVTRTAVPFYVKFGNNGNFGGYTGEGYKGMIFWGVQFEAGSFPTSYIKTTGSQVTRSDDDAVMTGTNFSDWYNRIEGTFYAEGLSKSKEKSASGLWGMEYANTGANRGHGVGIDTRVSSESVDAGYRTDVGVQGIIINTTTIDTNIKSASAYTLNSTHILSVNGGISSSANAYLTGTEEILLIGNVETSGVRNYLCGYLKKLSYYPTRLTDNEITDLTEA